MIVRDRSDERDRMLQLLSEQLLITQQQLRLVNDQTTLRQWSVEQRYKIVPTQLIGFSALSASPLYTIDRGRDDGIRPGMAVVIERGIVVGTILDVREHQSTVLPITHPRTRLAGAIANAQRTIGIVEGNANLSLQLTLIPKSESLMQGQLVMTSGLQERIPRSLMIGSISEVHNDPANIFQSADIRPLADIRRFTTLAVVLGAL